MNTPVRIQKEENDPIALRASIGGTEKEGFYLVYRGDRQKILEMLMHTIKYFELYNQIPEMPATEHMVKVRFGGS